MFDPQTKEIFIIHTASRERAPSSSIWFSSMTLVLMYVLIFQETVWPFCGNCLGWINKPRASLCITSLFHLCFDFSARLLLLAVVWESSVGVRRSPSPTCETSLFPDKVVQIDKTRRPGLLPDIHMDSLPPLRGCACFLCPLMSVCGCHSVCIRVVCHPPHFMDI